MGFNYNNMADTTNATYDGGIDVPHECLSGANISINPETSKQFPKFNIKQRDAGHENLHPVRIELLQKEDIDIKTHTILINRSFIIFITNYHKYRKSS